MHPHRFAKDLLLHDDGELEAHLHATLVERVELHAWPLSSVERLVLSDGRRLIYKAQLPPTLEAVVYAQVSSELLPRGEVMPGPLPHGGVPTEQPAHGGVMAGPLPHGGAVPHQPHQTWMLFEDVGGERLDPKALSVADLIALGRELTARIARFSRALPVFVDVGDESKWTGVVEQTLRTLHELLTDGRFRRLDPTAIPELRRALLDAPILDCIRRSGGNYAHGDFHADNILITPSGVKVIDWQRPWRGPADADLAFLLEHAGIDPYPYLGAPAVQIRHALLVNWAVQSADRWLPSATSFLDTWAERSCARILAPEKWPHGD